MLRRIVTIAAIGGVLAAFAGACWLLLGDDSPWLWKAIWIAVSAFLALGAINRISPLG